jgi:hypothetical protein
MMALQLKTDDWTEKSVTMGSGYASEDQEEALGGGDSDLGSRYGSEDRIDLLGGQNCSPKILRTEPEKTEVWHDEL